MTTQEVILVMQAYNDGKKIECRYKGDESAGWIYDEKPFWDWNDFEYRVKPEPPKPEYVPYESAEEFLQAQREHGWYIRVTGKYGVEVYFDFPVSVFQDGICFDVIGGEIKNHKYEELLEIYQWADGTPCGKLKGGKL